MTPESASIASAACSARCQRRPPVGGAAAHAAVARGEHVDLAVGLPRRALDGDAQLLDQRPERRPLLGDGAVVTLDDGQRRHRHARASARTRPRASRRTSPRGWAISPGRVVRHRRGDDVAAHAEVLAGQRGERLRDRAERVPVRPRLPRRRDGLVERVHERVHVGHRQVVLLVPGGRGQHDVRVQARSSVMRKSTLTSRSSLPLRDLLAPAHARRALRPPAAARPAGRRARRRAGGAGSTPDPCPTSRAGSSARRRTRAGSSPARSGPRPRSAAARP